MASSGPRRPHTRNSRPGLVMLALYSTIKCGSSAALVVVLILTMFGILPDGVTWTRATANAQFPARWWPYSVVFDNKMWVIGGQDNCNNTHERCVVFFRRSNMDPGDRSCTIPGEGQSYGVVFDNKIWVIGGNTTWWNAS